MDNKVRHILRQVNLVYYGVYLVTILTVVAVFLMTFGEVNFSHIDEKSTIGTNISTFYIIYLLLSIPFALYSFNKKCKSWKLIDNKDEMFEKYKKAASLRVIIIGIGLVVGVILVYVLNSRSMIFCSAIAAVSLYFTKPTIGKIKRELGIE